MMDWAHWKIDPRIVRTFIDRTGDTIRWLEEQGCIFNLMAFFPNQTPVVVHKQNRKAEVTDAPAGTKGKLDLVLVREGEKVAETSFPAPEPLRSIDVRRAGSYVVGYVNGAQHLAYKDPAPLDQSKVAWLARGAKVPDEGVDVSSGAVRNYTFGRAPVDWRIAKGIWTVTNKWQCDPRWSFWSGRAETTRGGSGGPVLSLSGEVVAVTSAVVTEFGGSNIGVPAFQALPLLRQTLFPGLQPPPVR